MKKLIPVLVAAALTTSCKNTWPQEDKDSLHHACMMDAETWAGSREKANNYCNCIVEKVMEKYPHVNDALEHINELAGDPKLKACKEEAMK